MPSTTPPVAASSSQMWRIWSSITDAGYVMRTAPWMPSTEPIGQRDVEEVASRASATSACRSPRRRAARGRSRGGWRSRDPVGLPGSESAMLRPSASTITTRPPARVAVARRERLRARASARPTRRRRAAPAARIASENASCWRSLVSRRSTEFAYDTPERDLEDEQDERGDREVADEQPPLHSLRPRPSLGERRAGGTRRRARSRSIPGSPSFLRNDATCTSSVFVGPYQCGSHTFSSSSWRGRTAPASSARNASRSNSFGVSATTSPSTVTRRVRRSTVERADLDHRRVVLGAVPVAVAVAVAVQRCGVVGVAAGVRRRTTARMRATSSRRPNGFTM